MHADSYVGVACIAYLQAYDATLFWFWLVCVAKQRLKQQEQIMLKNFIQWQQCGGFVAQQFPNALHNFFFGLQIMEFVKESHYQLACTRYYELTHGVFTFQCNLLIIKVGNHAINRAFKKIF